MAKDLECPICNADIPLAGDEKKGEEIFCAYCRAPLIVQQGADDDELLLEEDY
ncbi:MAG: lysine biosynthesis protein LysW [bacterium]|nr:lysine biosynthesis protein LysW [bacterium]